jgi:hypothetical protein
MIWILDTFDSKISRSSPPQTLRVVSHREKNDKKQNFLRKIFWKILLKPYHTGKTKFSSQDFPNKFGNEAAQILLLCFFMQNFDFATAKF